MNDFECSADKSTCANANILCDKCVFSNYIDIPDSLRKNNYCYYSDSCCEDRGCVGCLYERNNRNTNPCLRCDGFNEYILAKSDREWTTGAKRDPNDGKGRMDLLPWAAIMEVSKHCQKGAEHYGEHNVDKGIPLSSLCDSGARHLAKFIDGWTDEDHLLAAAWNILWALQMKIKKPEMIDIPWEDHHGA